mgnify:CR=1 FL=1
MTKAACIWCWKPVKPPANYNNRTQKLVCSQGCKDAEALFQVHYSDEEINRRAHYRYLTKGSDNG